jgi:glycosyltransferase involved in cell wall biosynthesis
VTGVAVIMPAYNEAATVRELASRVLEQGILLVVVDDGSTDETAQSLDGLPLTLLRNGRNAGKAVSIHRGIAYALAAGCERIITMDADGQHLPEDIPRLLEAAERFPARIIIGARRRGASQAPRMRRFANRFADFWISWAAGHPVHDSQSGLRLYSGSVLERVRTRPREGAGFVFESEILIDAAASGILTESIDIDSIYHPDRRHNHYRPAADTWTITRMVAGKLIRRGLYPIGLLRALGLAPPACPQHRPR